MTTAKTSAFPVKSLQEHVIAMEAAITVCQVEAKPRVVHKLRTEASRIEAHLELLALMDGVPPFRRKARKVMRQLRKIRRAAGRVRDLDVQERLLTETTSNDASELQRSLQKRRKRAAKKLVELLEDKQKKVVRLHEALLEALAPAEDVRLGPADLLALVDKHFRGLHALMIRQPSEEHLHSIRKAAKAARYQAELAAGSAAARRAAEQFEALQDAGGQWHDWLDLAAVAAEELGDDDGLAAKFAEMRDQRLVDFRGAIEELR